MKFLLAIGWVNKVNQSIYKHKVNMWKGRTLEMVQEVI